MAGTRPTREEATIMANTKRIARGLRATGPLEPLKTIPRGKAANEPWYPSKKTTRKRVSTK